MVEKYRNHEVRKENAALRTQRNNWTSTFVSRFALSKQLLEIKNCLGEFKTTNRVNYLSEIPCLILFLTSGCSGGGAAR